MCTGPGVSVLLGGVGMCTGPGVSIVAQNFRVGDTIAMKRSSSGLSGCGPGDRFQNHLSCVLLDYEMDRGAYKGQTTRPQLPELFLKE